MAEEAAPRYWKPQEIADELRLSRMTVYRLIYSGELAAIKVGDSFRVSAHVYEQYKKDCGTAQ